MQFKCLDTTLAADDGMYLDIAPDSIVPSEQIPADFSNLK